MMVHATLEVLAAAHKPQGGIKKNGNDFVSGASDGSSHLQPKYAPLERVEIARRIYHNSETEKNGVSLALYVVILP